MIEYSFIVPIYNDAALADDFCKEFGRVFSEMAGEEDLAAKVELIFVSDGSTAEQFESLTATIGRYPFAKALELSRNFGQHIAVSAGYDVAKGNYVGMLNVDQEDPPDQIPLLLAEMKKNGWDYVCGLYTTRHKPIWDRLTSNLFYRLMGRLTGFPSPTNAATLRIMNRTFVNAYLQFQEKSRYLPMLETWLGFKRGFVAIRHQPRKVGKSSYNFRKRLNFAIESMVTFSDAPLRATTLVGTLIALAGFALITGLVAQKIFWKEYLPGYTSTMAVIVFLSGVNILTVGFGSLYIGRILREVLARPLYVVRQKVGF